MKRYFLVAKDVGDLTRIFCTSLEFDHAKPLDMMGRVTGMFKRGKVAIKGETDFVVDCGRLNTARPDGFQTRSAQHHQELPRRVAQRPAVPSRRDQGDRPFAAPHRCRCAQRQDGQRLVPRDPDLAPHRRAHPAPDERERRSRPVRARIRQDRRPDAVQHVPPLHGGRAPDPRGRRDGRDRQWRAARTAAADARAAAVPQRYAPALRRAVPPRYRQGAPRGSLDRRRAASPEILPASRARCGRDRYRRRG